MNPSSIYPVILAIALALGTVTLVHKIAGGQLHSGKYSSIDGLRGYLAFFVFSASLSNMVFLFKNR